MKIVRLYIATYSLPKDIKLVQQARYVLINKLKVEYLLEPLYELIDHITESLFSFLIVQERVLVESSCLFSPVNYELVCQNVFFD